MKIGVLGAGHVGSTVGRLWHQAGHKVTFAARAAAADLACRFTFVGDTGVWRLFTSAAHELEGER